MFISRHYMNEVFQVDQSAPFDASLGHLDMPNAILLQPGFYKGYIFDKATGVMSLRALDMREPGLYQIFIPINEVGPGNTSGSTAGIYYRIVASTPEALACAVAELTPFGTAHASLTVQQRINLMMTSPVSLQCGEASAVLVQLAAAAGYQARMVACYTTNAPNNYNDGHTCVEMKIGGKWVMIDPSLNFIVKNECGDMLSMDETCEAVREGGAVFQEIAPFQYDGHVTSFGTWNPWGWATALGLHDDAKRAQAAHHLYRIPLVFNGSVYCCYVPEGAERQTARLQQIGYQVMTREAFMAAFYP